MVLSLFTTSKIKTPNISNRQHPSAKICRWAYGPQPQHRVNLLEQNRLGLPTQPRGCFPSDATFPGQRILAFLPRCPLMRLVTATFLAESPASVRRAHHICRSTVNTKNPDIFVLVLFKAICLTLDFELERMQCECRDFRSDFRSAKHFSICCAGVYSAVTLSGLQATL